MAAAVMPAAPTSARRDSVAPPPSSNSFDSSNRFDELMSVTPNGFRCVNTIKTKKYADAYLSGRALLALLLPARGGGIVAFVSADPFLTGRRLFQLPERCLGHEPVYQEFAGFEGGLAMRRADRYQHDAITGLHAAVAMHNECSLERPAAVGLGLDVLERLLGHAGIVFQGQ